MDDIQACGKENTKKSRSIKECRLKAIPHLKRDAENLYHPRSGNYNETIVIDKKPKRHKHGEYVAIK
jgi:hypothetical protein